MSTLKKIEKAKKNLESVCWVAGWDLKKGDNFQEVMQIKHILKDYNKLVSIIKEYNFKRFSKERAEKNYYVQVREALDFLNENINKNQYFKKSVGIYENPISGFLNLVETYIQSVNEGKFSDLSGNSKEEVNVEDISKIKDEIKFGKIRPF